MSRVSYSDEEDYPGQFGIFNANINRSLRGRRGQAALRELEAALLALPRKRLVRHVVACNGDVCAVGAVMLARKAREVGSVEEAQRQLEQELGASWEQESDDTSERGERLGMPRLVAWKTVAMNDIEIDGHRIYVEGPLTRDQAWEYDYYGYRGIPSWHEYTPEERYEKVLAWVREQLK